MKFSSLAVPGAAPGFTVKAVIRGDIRDVRVTDYSGKYLIIIFYAEDYGCRDELIKFHEQIDKFEKLKCEVVACSTDSPQCHKSWINASRDDDGFSGNLSIPLLSDPSGGMSSLYDCFDEEEGICRNAVVIIDNSGVVRHSMGTTMSNDEVVSNCLDIIKILKKHGPVSDKERARDISPVHVDPEKDWDVSNDPALQKVLQLAKMLGKSAPPRAKSPVKKATFGLNAAKVRRLVNPKAPVRSCRVTLHRNLSGFNVTDLSKSQRLQIETLMKKVMGVAYMPEEITGKYQSMTSLNQRQRINFLEDEVFEITGDAWLRDPDSYQWKDGSGVFINNYRNFLVWINRENQLRLVSAQKGGDMKYVLLRLSKAVTRMEEAIQVCQQSSISPQHMQPKHHFVMSQVLSKRGFAENEGSYLHKRQDVFGTALEATFIIDLPGYQKAGRNDLERRCQELQIKVEPVGKDNLSWSVKCRQFKEDAEADIVERTVEAVDTLWKLDQEQQQKFGIKNVARAAIPSRPVDQIARCI